MEEKEEEEKAKKKKPSVRKVLGRVGGARLERVLSVFSRGRGRWIEKNRGVEGKRGTPGREYMPGTMVRWLLLPFAAGTRSVRCKRCCGRFTEENSGVQNARRNAVQRGKANELLFLQMEAAKREG